ncbi:hypothetical protein J6TS7_40260 [Paenibacillus dendritiformis]|nr:hypothetical protein J6TS7_40260 [Paenibacillus dendritiformis]
MGARAFMKGLYCTSAIMLDGGGDLPKCVIKHLTEQLGSGVQNQAAEKCERSIVWSRLMLPSEYNSPVKDK